MSLRSKAISSICLTVSLIGLAILVWAYQTGRITIFGSGQNDVTRSATSLITTGQTLWLNILVALILGGIFAYLISKKKPR